MTKNGAYTTKTGYVLLQLETEQPNTTQFNWQANIWKLRTSPKIKTFLWKAAVNGLPVGEALQRRGIEVDGLCKRCGALETVQHMLISCPFAQAVWELAPVTSPHRLLIGDSVSELLSKAKKWINLPPSGCTAHLHAWI
ncbi:unnamed protein product [Arabis nemorensis]|uniref:Reverse transcriptase zinc-binding domain-containing protein n=1 Tax=Arabis nemorensis TaxID=586526 RepID=A0A565C7W4_9BRAS|nr:unnamed protein product [Arabis nemorensis]